MQGMQDLKQLLSSISPHAPMRVVYFPAFESFGKLPRSSDGKTVDVSEIPGDTILVFVSHQWLRPHTHPKMAHPDDTTNSKHKLICGAVTQLAASKKWDTSKICLWLDYCGLDQDNATLLQAGMSSLFGYISVCDAMLVLSPEVPEEGACTVDKIGGGFGLRAWSMLELMCFFLVCLDMLCMRLCMLVFMYACIHVYERGACWR
jgi:hypothetical protein